MRAGRLPAGAGSDPHIAAGRKRMRMLGHLVQAKRMCRLAEEVSLRVAASEVYGHPSAQVGQGKGRLAVAAIGSAQQRGRAAGSG